MDRKQAGIIASLVVLILIVGVATFALRDKVPNDLNGKPATHDISGIEGDEDSFTDYRLERDNAMVAHIQTLEALIEAETTGDEARKTAEAQLMNMIKEQEMEGDLEKELNAKGYDNVLCMVAEDFNNVNVYVKTKDDLTEEDYASIRATVISKTEINEVEISRKH